MTDAPASEPTIAAHHHHVGLTVANLEAQKRWYQAAFGLMHLVSHQPTQAIRTALLRAPNGLQLELIEAQGSQRSGRLADALEAAFIEGYGHWAVEVDDAVAAFHFLLRLGATAAREPMTGPTGTPFAYVNDPEGNLIELIER